jgi:hypothetical protein
MAYIQGDRPPLPHQHLLICPCLETKAFLITQDCFHQGQSSTWLRNVESELYGSRSSLPVVFRPFKSR